MYKLILLIVIGFFPYKSKPEKIIIESKVHTPAAILKQDSIISNKLDDLKFVYSLNSRSDDYLGDLYVKEINDSVFSSLLIVEKLENSHVRLYEVNNYTFSNKNGVDIEIRKNDFWGYRFELKRQDYFILTALHDKGKSVSDPIEIKWNDRDKIFEVSKTP